jgi:hypothetical protein
VSSPPPPKPQPGWYPDPNGAKAQRYFDGEQWTEQLAPLGPSPLQQRSKGGAKSSRKFVILLIASLVAGLVSFVLMQLVFGASAAGGGIGLLELLGFALFAVWLACIVGFLVGLIGAIVRVVQR